MRCTCTLLCGLCVAQSSQSPAQLCWPALLCNTQWIITPLHAVLRQVRVAEVDSHALFRMTSDVQALVVLLRPSERMPRHYRLAATLKKQKSWDEL